MKWRGRRQSSNVVDLLTAPKIIKIGWSGSAESHDDAAIIIDTDGTVYAGDILEETDVRQLASASEVIRFYLVSMEKDPDKKTPTLGQKATLSMLIKEMTKRVDPNDITVMSPEGEDQINIAQYVQSLLNTN